MSGAPSSITGRCLCGGVTYKADAEPVIQAVCHCEDCQRQTANPFSIVVGVPEAAFSVEGDTLASYTTTAGDSGSDTVRHFCSACGSPLFTLTSSAPGLVIIKAGSLDDFSWFEPTVEIWTSSAQPWAPHFEQAAQLERGPR
jgi:hypothetical protein